MSKRTFVGLCFVPLAVLVTAFFLLPMARLILTGASGQDGLRAYAAILLDPRYRATLFNTISLAAATTIATLVIATISGLFLQRHRFPGHALLVAMLTFPLAFPGVVQAELYLEEGEVIRPVRLDADRRGYVIAVADTNLEALERAEAAATLLDVEVE